jgi:hypothetical protein
MSTTKAEIKQGTAHEIGVKLDDQLDAAERQIGVLSGAVTGCISAAKKIAALVVPIQRDLDEGKLAMPEDSMALAKMLIQQVKRASAVAESEAQAYGNRKLQQEGIVAGLRAAVTTAKQVHDVEAAKAARGEDGKPSGEGAREARRQTRAARKKPAAKKTAKKKTAKKKATKKPARTRK